MANSQEANRKKETRRESNKRTRANPDEHTHTHTRERERERQNELVVDNDWREGTSSGHTAIPHGDATKDNGPEPSVE